MIRLRMATRNNDAIFKNEFDLTSRTLDEVEIRETSKGDNCFIWDRRKSDTAYDSFILTVNSQSKTICELKFYKSSKTNKYLPRPTFLRRAKSGDIRTTSSADKVIIKLDDSDSALRFWNLIGFLSSYKDLVDTGEFTDSFKVVAKDSYVIEFKEKATAKQLEDLKELIDLTDLSSSNLRSITFEQRKKNIRAFYHLLKNIKHDGGLSLDIYRAKYGIRSGDEYIWHHFIKKYDWILGLNIDARFIIEFLEEQKIGLEDSHGRKSPITDFLGVTDFTTIIELKHSDTKIFKENRSKARANTWDFTSDFIEGISQCLGQKFDLDKSFDHKEFVKGDNTRLDKSDIQSVDPKAILLIGNKKTEFPINNLDDTNLLKNKTFQRFRRNNRNIDILTYDELFERAYQIVYSMKLPKNWYWMREDEILEK